MPEGRVTPDRRFPPQAGRKAQASKEQEAKAVLVRKLQTTRDLDDSSEGCTTDSTEAV